LAFDFAEKKVGILPSSRLNHGGNPVHVCESAFHRVRYVLWEAIRILWHGAHLRFREKARLRPEHHAVGDEPSGSVRDQHNCRTTDKNLDHVDYPHSRHEVIVPLFDVPVHSFTPSMQ
jgi:hypothetical protein